MKRAGPLACLCVLALSAPGVAAARARAVDFELARPSAGAAAAGPYRSPVLRAPRRFDLVGMRWSGRLRPTISLRARKAGGRWSKWTRVPADPGDAPDRWSRERSPRSFSAPVWTGASDFVQYHLSRAVPGLRLHFVGVSGLPRPNAITSRRTDASGGPPPIQPRSAWGAEDCPPRAGPDYGQVQAAFVHHTVSANDYTPDEVPSLILSICRYHRNSNGWNDIGYNFLVDKFGTIWEGRAGGIDQPVVGAQAQGYNSQTTGIADIGDHQDAPAGDAELNAFAALIRWKLPLHGAPTQGEVTLVSGGGSLNRYKAGTPVTVNRVAGHRDGDSTACPGEALYAQLPDLRARVGDVEPGRARTRIAAAVAPAAVVYPATATVTGTLTQINGDPVAGVDLPVQAYGGSGWRTAWHAMTAADGSFSVPVAARLSHALRVQYPGDPGRLPAVSKPLQLNVVPALTIARSASRRPVGQTVTISGAISPAKTRLLLIVESRDGKVKAVGKLALRASHGRFRRIYRFHATGLFRFRVAFAGDKANAPAQSPPVYVRATQPATAGGGAAADV